MASPDHRTGRMRSCVLLFVLCCVPGALNQTATSKQDASLAERIWARGVRAQRGNHSNLASLQVEGTFTIRPVSGRILGDFRVLFKAPDSDLSILETVSDGQVKFGHEHGRPWVQTISGTYGPGPGSINGVTPALMAAAWRAFYEPYRREDYSKIELAGTAQVEGKKSYALRFVPSKGDPLNRYLDVESFLISRTDLAQRLRRTKDGPDEAYVVTIYYSGYAETDGLEIPRHLRAETPFGDLDFEVTKVLVDAPISDSLFTDPKHSHP